MKQVTLNFREVAVDGLPTESMDCAVVHAYDGWFQPNKLSYSSKYEMFNAHDYTTIEEAERTMIDNISHWIPLDEFNAAFEDGETP
jgi:hypothetical protein